MESTNRVSFFICCKQSCMDDDHDVYVQLKRRGSGTQRLRDRWPTDGKKVKIWLLNPAG